MAFFTPMPREDARQLVEKLPGFFTIRAEWSWAEMPPAAAALAKKCSIGGGPKFQHYDRFPRRDWLDEYANGRISAPERSTSEVA
jgi:hypothetical protein